MYELHREDADPPPSSAATALMQVNSTDPGVHDTRGLIKSSAGRGMTRQMSKQNIREKEMYGERKKTKRVLFVRLGVFSSGRCRSSGNE